ncbi:MAG: aminotransferase class III-fold pyridoxal phosphate-dependent enzyme [Deltaproteobacteria bacterium]|nr:aminotransferase class III-fold pyridoxal phosphate-dependent enzyme [Deltaproteobacteria bacterium]
MEEIPGHVFPRRLDAPLPFAVNAEGVWIVDSDGKRYLDASGGPLVVNLGHGREEIARAIYDQVLRCEYVHPTMFTTSAVESLAEALAAHAPKGLERFYFLSGGGEAVETAVKLARQIHLEHGRAQKILLISRWKSFHGLTLGALAATGRTTFRTPFAPLLAEVVHIPPPYCLRCSYGLTYPGCDLRCARALEETIHNLGAETVSAFIAETVSGATLAAVEPPPEYFRVIREICDRNEVLLILDEVLCGLGRTGRWFACEHYGVIPDIMTLGKGLGGGAIALSAVGIHTRHFDAIRNGGGRFTHGGTFSHHSVAAAAGLRVVRILEREKLVERVASFGEILGQKLKKGLAGHAHVADVRGLGFLWGVEFVKEKSTLQPFPRKEAFVEALWRNLFKRGLILYSSTGLAGADGDALIIGPPFVIEEAQLDFVVETMIEGLKETLVRNRQHFT